MRVAFVTEVWEPTVNGIVTRLRATVDQLVSDNHEVLIVCPEYPECSQAKRITAGAIVVRAVPTVSVPFIYGGQRWGLPTRQVRRYLTDFAPDVVHVANPVSLGVSGVRAARRLRIPLVCSYHTDIAAYAGHYHLGWLRPVIHAHLRRLHREATLNLVTSAAAGRQLKELGINGRPDGRGAVELWQRGVALEQFRPAASPVCPSERPAGPFRALYVGRLASEKRIGDLVTLAADPNFALTVVGDGPARAALVARLPTSTIFTGTLQGAELAAAYRSADLFVFPSVTDTLGLVLLEALASGLPVLAADSPASRELLEGVPAARLWTPGQVNVLPQLGTELLESTSCSELVSLARAQVDGRTWSAATSQLLGYYRLAQTLANDAQLQRCAGHIPVATRRRHAPRTSTRHRHVAS